MKIQWIRGVMDLPMRPVWILLSLMCVIAVAPSSAAQEAPGDFGLPAFEGADAGVLAPPSAPPPPPSEVVALPQGRDAGPPPAPQWSPISGTLGFIGMTNGRSFVGLDTSLGVGFGSLSPEELGAQSGWLVVPALEFTYLQLTASSCGAPTFCGTRLTGGPSVRLGWARGMPSESGWVSPSTYVYGQLGVLGGLTSIPSAPLSPGERSGELVLRGRVGLNWSDFGGGQGKGLVVNIALLVEGVPVGGFTRGVYFGGSLGLGF